MVSSPQQTKEHARPGPQKAASNAFQLREGLSSALFKVDIAVRSHCDESRPGSEDHFLVARATRSLQTVRTNLPEAALPDSFDEVAHGMLVASGMGGMPAGKIASAMAICKLMELVENTPDWIMKINRRKASVVMRRMKERFHQIDATLKEHTEKDPELIGMSAILTVAVSLGADLFLGHIGDSRAYLLRGSQLHQLTRDHTLAQALIDAGISEAENAIVQGMRRVLTAALGTARLKVEPQIQHLRLCDGDQMLLCTNGLIETVDDGMIGSVLHGASETDEACRNLIDTAVSGGSGNVTVVLARYQFP